MSDDFYPFVDSGDPVPDNSHITGNTINPQVDTAETTSLDDESTAAYATRIAVYDDMLSTPRVIVIAPAPVRSYLEEVTNTVYRCMKEQGGRISLMVIREIVENFIHAHFVEPIISILDGGNTIRFADQGPGIEDKERAFEFGVTSADRDQKRYIRGTGAGFPMVQEYLENAGGAVSIEDNLGQGTVVTVSLDPARVLEIQRVAARGGAVRSSQVDTAGVMGTSYNSAASVPPAPQAQPQAQYYQNAWQMPQQAWGQQGYYQQPMGGMNATPGQPYMPVMQSSMQTQQTWGAYPPAYTTATPQMQAPQTNPYQTVPNQGNLYISARGMQALTYLLEHTSCGPTDLERAFGSSVSTWSRELETLQQHGFVVKQGQKRILTEIGRSWVQEQMDRG